MYDFSITPGVLDYVGAGLAGDHLRYQGDGFEIYSHRTQEDLLFVKERRVYACAEGELPVALERLPVTKVNTIIMHAILKKYRVRQLAMLEMTYDCNLRCVHCYLPDRPGMARGHKMTLQRINQIIEGMKRLHVLELSITGGEVLLDREFIEIVQKLSEYFVVNVLSNATLVTEVVARELSRVKIKNFRSTLYSYDPAVHDAIVGIAGSYLATLNGLELLKRHGVPLAVNVPVLKQNIDDLAHTRAWLESHSIPYAFDYLIFPSTERALDSLVDPQRLADEAHLGNLQPICSSVCSAYYGKLRIDPTGDVFPCEYLDDPIGNLFSDDCSETALAQSYVEKYGKDAPITCGPCDCNLNGRCFICPARNRLDSGNYQVVSPYLCELTRRTHGALA